MLGRWYQHCIDFFKILLPTSVRHRGWLWSANPLRGSNRCTSLKGTENHHQNVMSTWSYIKDLVSILMRARSQLENKSEAKSRERRRWSLIIMLMLSWVPLLSPIGRSISVVCPKCNMYSSAALYGMCVQYNLLSKGIPLTKQTNTHATNIYACCSLRQKNKSNGIRRIWKKEIEALSLQNLCLF